MLLDIDYFKVVNDTYGHQTGDLVLKRLSEMVNATIRNADCFARYGGEEFCILMPSTSELDALVLAERIRNAYAALVFEVNGQSFQSTLSIGVAILKALDCSSISLLQRPIKVFIMRNSMDEISRLLFLASCSAIFC
ncbi:GGDEF domain-containing protein [Methylocucumis oryzae]|uniref:GGDEF domain-containing protein n=1 Tax=Methylocucumis oryzae TaxID=1632867 RepID=UPI000696E8F2|nr:GGDEF domain-containing protein [Methylocucumis oryzae]